MECQERGRVIITIQTGVFAEKSSVFRVSRVGKLKVTLLETFAS